MIISRTPTRISYVGGGSDFQEHFDHSFGSVIGTTINQYVYVYMNPLSEISQEKIRFTYRQTESVDDVSSLMHPVLRVVLEELRWNSRVNLGTFSDLPAGIGLGGSSAFTVGLANLLFHYRNMKNDPSTLANFAVKIERQILKESGGWQDQFHAAYGGLRHYKFSKAGVEVSKKLFTDEAIQLLNKQQMLVWVGRTRNSASHAEKTRAFAKSGISDDFSRSAGLSQSLFNNLKIEKDSKKQFQLLVDAVNEGWAIKRQYITEVSPQIEEIFQIGFREGAAAVKLCGAGGSGFVLVLFEERNLERLKSAFRNHIVVFPKVTNDGSNIIIRE